MHSFFALAAFLLATTTLALPTAPPAGGPQAPPPTSISATLMGATPEDQTTISIPLDSQFHFTNVESSISHIQTSGGPCVFFGVDGLMLKIEAATYVDVGPPQVLAGVSCGLKPAF